MKTMLLAALAAAYLFAHPACAETLKVFIESAKFEFDQVSNGPVIMIELKPESTVAFETFTTARVGEAIKIRLGIKTILEPIIREPIKAGTLMISGQLTEDEAREMALGMSEEGVFLEVDGSDKQLVGPRVSQPSK
jgi:preprotein translocase subunit SecD